MRFLGTRRTEYSAWRDSEIIGRKSGHTSPVRADARRCPTGKRITLRCIKWNRASPWNQCHDCAGELLYQQHRSRAVGTEPRGRRGRSAFGHCTDLLCLLSKQLLAKWQERGPTPVCQEAEEADTDEGTRQYVQQEA